MRQFPTIDLLLMGTDRQPEDCSQDELDAAKIIDIAWKMYQLGHHHKLTYLAGKCQVLMEGVDLSIEE